MRCTKYALDFGFHWQHAPLFVTILPFHNLSHNMRLLTENSISELTEDVSVCLCSTESVEWYRESNGMKQKSMAKEKEWRKRQKKMCVTRRTSFRLVDASNALFFGFFCLSLTQMSERSVCYVCTFLFFSFNSTKCKS